MKRILLALAAIIFVSACTMPGVGPSVALGQASPTQGVVINKFTFAPSLLVGASTSGGTDGWTGALSIEVQNKGGVTAQQVNASLFNMNFGDWAVTKSYSDFGDLLPPDAERKLAGMSGSDSWEMRAPFVPEGLKLAYEPRVRVCYGYNTTASASFIAMNSSEWRIEQQTARLEEKAITTTNSGAPIHFTIDARAPVIFTTATPNVKLNIKATNMASVMGTGLLGGGGVSVLQGLPFQSPTANCLALSGLNQVVVNVAISGATCVTRTGVTCSGSTASATINVIEGQEGSKVFEFTLPSSMRQQYDVVITSTYGYFVEAKTTMSVRAPYK